MTGITARIPLTAPITLMLKARSQSLVSRLWIRPFGDKTPALLIMMSIKFAMVLMFFMHLRSDNKLFSAVFIAGLVLAGAVYGATLLTFGFF